MNPSRLEELKEAARVNTLRSCQLFAGLAPADLKRIAAIAVLKNLEKGDYLFREGDPSHGFYVVQKGAINVHRVSAWARNRSSASSGRGNRLPRQPWRPRPGIQLTPGPWNRPRYCSCTKPTSLRS